MNKSEASDLLQVIGQSLMGHPNQFSYSANVHVEEFTGFKIGGGPPGAPVTIQSNLSGSADTMVGAQFHASLDVSKSDVQLATAKASEDMHARISEAARIIDEMAAEMRKSSPESSGITKKMSALAQLSLPVLVAEVVRAILRHAGIQGI